MSETPIERSVSSAGQVGTPGDLSADSEPSTLKESTEEESEQPQDDEAASPTINDESSRPPGAEPSCSPSELNPPHQAVPQIPQNTPDSNQSYISNFQFNQDGSCFSLSTSSGFRIFTVDPVSEFSRRKIVESPDHGIVAIDDVGNIITTKVGNTNADNTRIINQEHACSISVCAMLYQTNYVALVFKESPYKVVLWDESMKQPPHEIWSRFEVLNVMMRRDVIAVISEYKIYLYEFGSFAVLMLLETISNPRGLCALSSGSMSGSLDYPWVLACPSKAKGSVTVQAGLDSHINLEISAHTNHVAFIALNQEGSLLATASESGTVIKIFSVIDLIKQHCEEANEGKTSVSIARHAERQKPIFVFRRGTTTAGISSLNFRADSKFIAVASTNATVHVFKLEQSQPDISSHEIPKRNSYVKTLSSIGGSIVSQATSSKYFQASRAHAQFLMPESGGKPEFDLRLVRSPLIGPLVTFGKNDSQRIFVVHFNGVLFEGKFEEKTEAENPKHLSVISVFFASRPDFKIQRTDRKNDENWQLL